MMVSQMVICTIKCTDADDLHNDLILIFNFIDMGTFRVGIKVKFKIIQYVYAYIISHMYDCMKLDKEPVVQGSP